MEARKQNREALLRALDLAHAKKDLKAIARESGVPYGSIRNFRSHGHIGDDKAEALEKWLAGSGIIPHYRTQGLRMLSLFPGDPAPQLAALLHTLGDIVENQTMTHQERAALARVQLQTIEQMISILDRFQPPEPVKPA